MGDKGQQAAAHFLGGIRALADGARESEAGRGVVEVLEATTERVAWLYANRARRPEPLGDPVARPQPPARVRPEDLPKQLQDLARKAQSRGVDEELTNYVQTVARRLRAYLDGNTEKRLAPRQAVELPAELAARGEVFAAQVVDRSMLGFGVVLAQCPAVEKGEFVTLILAEWGLPRRYDCLVVYCTDTADDGGFRMGLDLFSEMGLEDYAANDDD
jgi:hypothetical protein